MITTDPRFDRNRQLAMAMMNRRSQPSRGNRHWTSGLSDALSMYLGARGIKQADEAEQSYKASAEDTIRQALSPDPVQVGEAQGPTQTPKTDRYSHLVNTLAGNPATAEMALQAQLQRTLKQPQSTSAIQNYQFRQSLTPEQQREYDKTQRGARYIDLGDRYQDTLTGQVIPKGVAKEKTPEFKGEVVAAQETAKTEAQQEAGQRTMEKKLPVVDELWGNVKDKDFDLIYGRGESIVPNLLRSQEGLDMQADIRQLVGMIKLGARGELKGQGTISDFESKMLGDAATVLEAQNISPEKARRAAEQAIEIIYRSAGREVASDTNIDDLVSKYAD